MGTAYVRLAGENAKKRVFFYMVIPCYKAVADDLKRKIAAGEYQDGERLPGAIRLSKLYHVSSVTANKALETLEAAGHVARDARRGTFAQRHGHWVLNSVLIPVDKKWRDEAPQLLSYLAGIVEEAAGRNIQVRMEPLDSPRLDTAETIGKLGCQAILQLGKADAGFPYQASRRSDLPWLVVGVSEKMEQPVISEDREQAAFDLISAMRGAKLKRIGFIGDLSRPNHRVCRDGYLRATREEGTGSVLVRDADVASLDAALDELLTLGMIDGLMVCGSLLLKALNVLRLAKATLPIGGFAENVAMTALRGEIYLAELDHYETGREAVVRLARAVRENLPLENALLPVKIASPRNATATEQ